MKLALGLALCLCLGSVAQADFITVGTFQVTWEKTTMSVGSVYGSYLVDVYDVRMVATTSNLWAGFEGTITGNLHQVYKDYGETATPLYSTAPTTWRNVHRIFDSYFALLSDGSEHIQAAPISETDPTVWATGAAFGDLSYEYGWTPSGAGQLVSGGFSVLPDYRATDKLFAHVVVPTGQSFTIAGTITDQTAAAQNLNIVIPEPATLSLLALGGVLTLVRRRRV